MLSQLITVNIPCETALSLCITDASSTGIVAYFENESLCIKKSTIRKGETFNPTFLLSFHGPYLRAIQKPEMFCPFIFTCRL
jgi:hypothetical protein